VIPLDDSGRLATIFVHLRMPSGQGAHRTIGGVIVGIVGPARIERWRRAVPGDVEGIAWVRVREVKDRVAALRKEPSVIDVHADAM
jgi:hypothetical protein